MSLSDFFVFVWVVCAFILIWSLDFCLFSVGSYLLCVMSCMLKVIGSSLFTVRSSLLLAFASFYTCLFLCCIVSCFIVGIAGYVVMMWGAGWCIEGHSGAEKPW